MWELSPTWLWTFTTIKHGQPGICFSNDYQVPTNTAGGAGGLWVEFFTQDDKSSGWASNLRSLAQQVDILITRVGYNTHWHSFTHSKKCKTVQSNMCKKRTTFWIILNFSLARFLQLLQDFCKILDHFQTRVLARILDIIYTVHTHTHTQFYREMLLHSSYLLNNLLTYPIWWVTSCCSGNGCIT